ncbi:serine hydrolase domain-containing protein [Marinobacter lacisalsi]|uniref:Serine hydrolase domain-containing protein n=1 Tax=Marinobacter lacisalsi TaxID=475979 RepID=A0ABV8QE37_9GAMM
MTIKSSDIKGYCHADFDQVREEFQRNFEEHGEIGASVAIQIDGETVVDLWAGTADQNSGRLWQVDTSAVIFSCGKGISSLCLHMLADRGQLDFEAPVAKYWPEFAANGKEKVTVAMVMAHQAGLPVWDEPLPDGAMLEWDLVTQRLAEQTPMWEPGTTHGYHALSHGYLVGEILRRIDGRTIGRFLAEEIAGPLKANAWIGLPEEEEGNVATAYFDEPSPTSPMFQKIMNEPDWFGCKLINNTGGDIDPAMINSRARHAVEIPAAGAIATARGLARIYSVLARDGSVDDIRLLKPTSIAPMATVRSASDVDLVLRVPTAFTLGYSKQMGHRGLGEGEHVIIGEHAFGHAGMGGSMGFADPQDRMSFAYVMNRHGSGVGLNNRGQNLVDAAYRSLGYSEAATGAWAKRI